MGKSRKAEKQETPSLGTHTTLFLPPISFHFPRTFLGIGFSLGPHKFDLQVQDKHLPQSTANDFLSPPVSLHRLQPDSFSPEKFRALSPVHSSILAALPLVVQFSA